MRTLLSIVFILFAVTAYAGAPISKETESCLNCHKAITPGIVEEWLLSRHSTTTLEDALSKPIPQRRVSIAEIKDAPKGVAIGCYECHGRNTQNHKDSFMHFGHNINVVVSPNDCATCHPLEVTQYRDSKKGHAVGNLRKNPVYHSLVNTIIGLKSVDNLKITQAEPSDFTRQETCFGCHGTELIVTGLKAVKTPLGQIQVPEIKNWPNQGVGRINPDGSRGSCTACHPRHSFSIEIARKPHTCSQCHLEPDVPAWDVYDESKHGNILISKEGTYNWQEVPWRVGKDFTAPSCSVCHVSEIATPDGSVVVERSHDFGSRLWVRLFGLIYTHPQPKSGDTSVIRNKDGLPLPTTFMGEAAKEYLIDNAEQQRRAQKMKSVCQLCHSSTWVEGHFAKMDNTIRETDRMTLEATKLLIKAWELGVADNSNPFDEHIEQLWIKQWLFYGNSIRYASAMTGAPDYTAFKYGWWGLTTNLNEMRDLIEMKSKIKKKKED